MQGHGHDACSLTIAVATLSAATMSARIAFHRNNNSARAVAATRITQKKLRRELSLLLREAYSSFKIITTAVKRARQLRDLRGFAEKGAPPTSSPLVDFPAPRVPTLHAARAAAPRVLPLRSSAAAALTLSDSRPCLLGLKLVLE